MILVDTSAWIEFLRDTDSAACRRLISLLQREKRIAICPAIWMEVMAGARDERHLHDLQRLLAVADILPIREADYEQAACLFRFCRQQGCSVRKLLDCLVAAVAIRVDVPVLHADRDFAMLEQCTSLRAISGLAS